MSKSSHGVEVLADVIIKACWEGKLWKHVASASHLACGLDGQEWLVHVSAAEAVACLEVLLVGDLFVLTSLSECVSRCEIRLDIDDCVKSVASMLGQHSGSNDLLFQAIQIRPVSVHSVEHILISEHSAAGVQ